MNGSNKLSICIITSPLGNAGPLILTNFLKILDLLEDIANIYLITSQNFNPGMKFEKVRLLTVPFRGNSKNMNIIKRIFNVIRYVLKSSLYLLSIIKQIDVLVVILGENLVIPLIFSKIFSKKSIMFVTIEYGAFLETQYMNQKHPLNITKQYMDYITERVSYILADILIVPKKYQIKGSLLEKYSYKVHQVNRHFLDDTHFRYVNKISKRPNIVGYFGRYSPEKGVIEFLNAITTIIKKRNLDMPRIHFRMYGDGILSNAMINLIRNDEIPKRYVEINSWVPHTELPKYLNIVKVLVIPSYKEVGPWILIEGIASGCLIVAPPIGLVPTLINKKTGIMIEDNTPESIASGILEAFKYPPKDLIKKVHFAREALEKKYNINRSVQEFTYLFRYLLSLEV